jgi:hypothetical protein
MMVEKGHALSMPFLFIFWGYHLHSSPQPLSVPSGVRCAPVLRFASHQALQARQPFIERT